MTSSAVLSHRYDEKAGEIVVRLPGGIQYAYKAPRALYDEMMRSRSAGQFFNRSIKGRQSRRLP